VAVFFVYCVQIRILTYLLLSDDKDDITLQHIAKMSLCSEVISSFFVIFAVLDLRVAIFIAC